jgi:hypothetical protein
LVGAYLLRKLYWDWKVSTHHNLLKGIMWVVFLSGHIKEQGLETFCTFLFAC